MVSLSLDPVCPCHLWILTALLVDSCEARELRHIFCMSSLSLETDGFSAAFHWCLFLLASLYVGISFLETFFSWHFLLSISHSLGTVSSWHHFSCICLSVCVHFLSLKVVVIQDLSTWHVLCLDVFFHYHVVLLASLSFDIFLPCYITKSILCTTKLAQRHTDTNIHKQTQKSLITVPHNLHKVVPRTTSYYKSLHEVLSSTVLLRTTILAQITSQYYFVLQRLHKHFPVRLCTTKVAQSTSRY